MSQQGNETACVYAYNAVSSRPRSEIGGGASENQHVASNGTLTIGLDGDTLGRKRTGDESYLASLMRGLGRVDSANDYTVYVRDREAVLPAFAELERFRFRNVRPASIWVRYPFSFPIALRRDPVDVLHVQYFIPPTTRGPVVLTVHDISFAVHPEFFTRKDRVFLGTLVPYALRRADSVITDAEFTKAEMVRVYDLDPNKIEVIPLAADPQYRPMEREACRARVAKHYNVMQPFFLYVGTLQPRKNVTTLIKAYAQFRRESGHAHKLVIVGKAKYLFTEIFEAIDSSGYVDDIVFTGFVPDDDLPVLYNAADAFVFPSLYEGFGLPPLEAMACGTPVIASNASCIPEVTGEAALLADPRDVDSFSDAMSRITNEPELAESLSARGLARAAMYTWDETARRTLAVYRRVHGERNGHA